VPARPPLTTIQLHAEGTFEYQALLFIPSQSPYDLFTREHRSGIHTLEKMYRAMGQDITLVKRILELNPTHPLVSELQKPTRRTRQRQDGPKTPGWPRPPSFCTGWHCWPKKAS
jgi:HSP90 family molecular chaperone